MVAEALDRLIRSSEIQNSMGGTIRRGAERLECLLIARLSDCVILSASSAFERRTSTLYIAGFANARGFCALSGIFAAAREGVPAVGRIGALHLIDVAPTVLARVSLPIPEDMDREVVAAIHNGRIVVDPGLGDDADDATTTSAPMTEQEGKLVEKRLRSLGYLG